MLDVGLLLGLVLACLAGALLTVFQLPGIWLTLAAAVAYAWYYDWQRLGLWTIGLLAGLAVLAEVAELFTGMWFAKRAGGSRRAAWWGLFGGIIGAVVLDHPRPGDRDHHRGSHRLFRRGVPGRAQPGPGYHPGSQDRLARCRRPNARYGSEGGRRPGHVRGGRRISHRELVAQLAAAVWHRFSTGATFPMNRQCYPTN